MNIRLTQNRDKRVDVEIVVIKRIKDIKNRIKKDLLSLGFCTKSGEPIYLNNIFYIGATKLKGEELKIALSSTIQKIAKTKFTHIYITIMQDSKELKIRDIVEGIALGGYRFERYKSAKKSDTLSLDIDISSLPHKQNKLSQDLKNSLNITKSVNSVRDFVNTAPEDFYPETMVKKAEDIAKESSLNCLVFGEEYLKSSGMNAMLAVGRASRHESKLIHLTYKPKNPKAVVVLVGKGLTYDCGGLSLKSSGGLNMKCDKSGGCAVLGIMEAISKLGYEYEVHGIIGAVENMIGGNAYKPDDILVAKNGKTIEVRNTDAEGRLVLADCLCYAQDEIKDIDYILDMATLTGACIVALGDYTTGVMGHNEKLMKRVQNAAKSSGELVGFLPSNRYLLHKMDSKVADILNSSNSRAGGAITASIFLNNFIKKSNKQKWIHLDIAGAAYKEESWGYNPYGASGAGVRLILDFIKNLKE